MIVNFEALSQEHRVLEMELRGLSEQVRPLYYIRLYHIMLYYSIVCHIVLYYMCLMSYIMI